jgi:PIN domain nuclease of toxin-antitoxin system
MKYMLDTNVLMHIVNFNTGYRRIIKHIQRTEKADMVLSAVSYFELTSKIMAAKLGKDKAETLAELVAQFKVMPYSGVDSVIVNMS